MSRTKKTELGKEWIARIDLGASTLMEDLIGTAEAELDMLGLIESPIEVALAVAMKLLIRVQFQEIAFSKNAVSSAREADGWLRDEPYSSLQTGIWAVVCPQMPIGPYRVDFAIRHIFGLTGASGIVVECDGHDFHEKTKEQAARDKERDRFLQSEGYRVLHFTGSEIWADPMDCAHEVLMQAFSRAQDSLAARMFLANGDDDAMKQHLNYSLR